MAATTLPGPLVQELLLRHSMSGSNSGKTASLTLLAAKEEEMGVQQQVEGRERTAHDSDAELQAQEKAARILLTANLTPPPAAVPPPAAGSTAPYPPLAALATPCLPVPAAPSALLPACVAGPGSAPLPAASPLTIALGAPAAALAPCTSAPHHQAPITAPPEHPQSPMPGLLSMSSFGAGAPPPRPLPPLPATTSTSAPTSVLSKLFPQQHSLLRPQSQPPANLATLVASNPVLVSAYLQLQRQQQEQQEQQQQLLLYRQAQSLQQQQQQQETKQPSAPLASAPCSSMERIRGEAAAQGADSTAALSPQQPGAAAQAGAALPAAPAALRKPRSSRAKPGPLHIARLLVCMQPTELELPVLLPTVPVKNPVGRPRKHPIGGVTGGGAGALKPPALAHPLPAWMHGLMQPEGQQLLNQLRQQQQEQQRQKQMGGASAAAPQGMPTQHRRKKFVPARAAV